MLKTRACSSKSSRSYALFNTSCTSAGPRGFRWAASSSTAASVAGTPGRSTNRRVSSGTSSESVHTRSTGTCIISPCRLKNSAVLGCAPSKRHKRAGRWRRNVSCVTHLHNAVVLPTPGAPTNTRAGRPGCSARVANRCHCSTKTSRASSISSIRFRGRVPPRCFCNCAVNTSACWGRNPISNNTCTQAGAAGASCVPPTF